MTTTAQWAATETLTQCLTTELNSLANAALSAVSSAIDNRTTRYQYISLRLHLASLTPTGVPFVNVYMFRSVDGGTTYDDASISSAHDLKASIRVTTGAGAKEETADLILIGPWMYKFALENQTAVALAASGNTLEYSRYKEESV